MDGYLSSGIWHNLLITYSKSEIQKVEINGVVAAKDISGSTTQNGPLRITCTLGEIAFGDVRLKQNQPSSVPSEWSSFLYKDSDIGIENSAEWQKSDSGGLIVKGDGAIVIPHGNTISAVRFDVKINGSGFATIQIGKVLFIIATQGERLTGSVNNHAVQANLVDQNEWCTIELSEGATADLILNGIPIYQIDSGEFANNGDVFISVHDVELQLRKVLVKPPGLHADRENVYWDIEHVLESDVEPRFVSLFNGENLDGWTIVNGDASTWIAQDNMLVTTGKPTGVLRTNEMYENFILELDWRHMVENGNAGLFVWSDPIPAKGVPFTRAIEVQIMDGKELDWYTTHGDIFSIWGAKMTPDRPHPHGEHIQRCLPSERRSKPSPEWNHYKVTCNEGTIKLEVNGKEVSGGFDVSPRKGYICFEAEGTPAQFKNIRIKKLRPSANTIPADEIANEDQGFTTLFTGINLLGWDLTTGKGWSVGDNVLRCNTESGTLQTINSFSEYTLMFDYQCKEDDSFVYVVIDGKQTELPNGEIGSWSRFTVDGEGGTIGIGGSNTIFTNLFIKSDK
ncbi:MAG: DUF1080 domain-containing protein [Phycisphaerae bacterium]|nr:DUF1080 domain-containing protein [Phycisphaerae bacterium]